MTAYEILGEVMSLIERTYDHDEHGNRTDLPGSYSGADVIEALLALEPKIQAFGYDLLPAMEAISADVLRQPCATESATEQPATNAIRDALASMVDACDDDYYADCSKAVKANISAAISEAEGVLDTYDKQRGMRAVLARKPD